VALQRIRRRHQRRQNRQRSLNKTGLLSENSPAETVTQHEKTIAKEIEIAAVEAKWKN
jgi:hypothetical protein